MDLQSFLRRFKTLGASAKSGYQQLAQQTDSDLQGRGQVNIDDIDPGLRNEEEGISLLDTQIQHRPRRGSGKHGVWRGIKYSLFWKVIGGVIGLICIVFVIKLGIRAFSPPTGLENMPTYSDSLECKDAPYIYNSSTLVVHSPIGSSGNNHFMDVTGLGVGTITIANGQDGAEDVEYSFTIRSNNPDLLEQVEVAQRHTYTGDNTVEDSRLFLNTHFQKKDDACVNFEVVIYVPQALKKLGVSSHAAKTHVRYHPDANIDLASSLFVTLYGTSSDNMIIPNEGIRSSRMGLEVYNGWIVGDISLVDDTSIKTQRGQGVTNVVLHSSGYPSDDPASLMTATGVGQTVLTYLGGKERRPIRSTHLSTSPKSEMHLIYSSSGFSGRVELDVKTFTTSGVDELLPSQPVPGNTKDTVKHKGWTHFVGDTDGPDELRVDTRGFAELAM